MMKPSLRYRLAPSFGRFAAVVGLCAVIVMSSPALAAAIVYPSAEAYYPPGYNPASYPANYNPYMIISDDNWRAGTSMSQADIQAFLVANDSVLKDYACAEGGPNGLHSQVIKPASQIIAEAGAYWDVNPKLILATLEKEQSLITQVWHTGTYDGPYPMPPGTTHSTWYHITNAMGVGCYGGSTDTHPGFGDQVWTGAEKLGAAPPEGSTSAYRWYPGKVKMVFSYPSAAYIDIAPMNQPTWNAYTYTPYFPQISVWRQYNKFFGDPLAFPGNAPVYRFYNVKNGSHFYTTSETERYTVIKNWPDTYQFEGPAYSINTTSPAMTQPLYRFYNKKNGSHFYTASPTEADNVIARYPATYSYEGPAYLVSLTPIGCAPMYRFYNRVSKSHFYTVSDQERDTVIATWPNVFTYEGIAYWVALSGP
ncbi:MAG: hypothetical protein EG823_06645 [Actinobacteria bacterium]|nr:hypothetical protein [Actinomycetota bacterium]